MASNFAKKMAILARKNRNIPEIKNNAKSLKKAVNIIRQKAMEGQTSFYINMGDVIIESGCTDYDIMTKIGHNLKKAGFDVELGDLCVKINLR